MSAQSRSPVALRVGQLMTGFGAGCGIGLGVGYPVALGSIPVLGDLMSATSSAGSRAFGGVGHKAFGMLRKLGIKNLKAGVGCGVGIGHGFGVGIALKPGVSQQILHSLQERLSAVASQLQKHLPHTEGDSEAAAEKSQPASQQDSSVGQLFAENKVADEASGKSKGYVQSDASSVVMTEPMKFTSTGASGELENLRQENEILRTLLRHQELIEDLKGQNASIRHVLSEQFDVHIGGHEQDLDRNSAVTSSRRVKRKDEMLRSIHSRTHSPDIKNCFDCRTSARRRR